MQIGKKILAIMIATGISMPVLAQTSNWQNKDLQQDGLLGISTEKAYQDLLKGKKAKTVIVGIVDSGVDTLQEDLKQVIWNDPKTGHHGRNFIGPETGREDITNLVSDKKMFYDSLAYTHVPEQYQKGYQVYRKLAPQLESKINEMQSFIEKLEQLNTPAVSSLIKLAQFHLEHGLNINNNEADTAKGNADVSPDQLDPLPHPNLTPIHGTHVAGIIGAVRGNGIGMDGIADHVQIIMLKTNGNIRELRDKSLALAIRFAVDHGARIINMSFGKPYTWDKKDVDDAVKYAMKKDVLLIHAAGNYGQNLDSEAHYPNPVYADNSGTASAWIEVGASGPKDDQSLAADFSNYGKTTVDVFAPGVAIYSTLPSNKYAFEDGTSMAAPVVAGLAALIREYYPNLTAIQVKDIIMKTVVKRDVLKEKCVSGGVINAYNALKLAATY